MADKQTNKQTDRQTDRQTVKRTYLPNFCEILASNKTALIQAVVWHQAGKGNKPMPRSSLQWRHNECAGISIHQPHDCLLNCLFKAQIKETSKLRITGLCNSQVTGEFPTQRASNSENVSIWWRHHVKQWLFTDTCIYHLILIKIYLKILLSSLGGPSINGEPYVWKITVILQKGSWLLTHWTLRDMAIILNVILKLVIQNSSLGTVKLLSVECHRTSLMRSPYWFS